MKFNILCNLKINKCLVRNDCGQIIIEFIVTYSLLLICLFAVIEIARLIAFKNCLQSTTSYLAHKIAYSQIDLVQKNLILNQDGIYENENKNIADKLSIEIEKNLNLISTTLFSFDNTGVLYLNKQDVRVYLKLVNNSELLPSGVYIEAQTCLPVLFSSYFRHFKGKSQVGNTIQDDSRTCLGHFNSSPRIPLYWFRVRVAAYSPWSASTQIFNHGLALPQQFELLEFYFLLRVLGLGFRVYGNLSLKP